MSHEWLTPIESKEARLYAPTPVDVVVLHDHASREYASRFGAVLRQHGFFPEVEEWTATPTLFRRASVVLCLSVDDEGPALDALGERVRRWRAPTTDNLAVSLTGRRRPYADPARVELGGAPCFYDVTASERELDLMVREWRRVDRRSPLEELAEQDGQLTEFRAGRARLARALLPDRMLAQDQVIPMPVATEDPVPVETQVPTKSAPSTGRTTLRGESKGIVIQDQARAQIHAGVETLARAVRATLGPRGRNVIIDRSFGDPYVTKDGVTVALEIELSDPYENMGATLVRNVMERVHDQVGDGATTAAVLAEAIFTEGLAKVTSGASPIALKRGIDAAVQAATARLKMASRPIRGAAEFARLVSLSSGADDEVENLVADAVSRVGVDGVLDVNEGPGLVSHVEWSSGLTFDRGYLSPHFATDTTRMECVLEDALILVHGPKISSIKTLLPLLEEVVEAKRPLVIVADDVEGEALATLVINRLRGTLHCVAVKAPGFGDRRPALLQDIASLTGATLVRGTGEAPNEPPSLELLGGARKVVITKDATTFIDCAGRAAEVDARVKQLRVELRETESDYVRERLEARLTMLLAGAARIHVGGTTESEIKSRKARIEDALHAARAGLEEGVVPGGGTALLLCIDAIESLALDGDERSGALVVRQALEAPLRQIAANAERDGDEVVQNVLRKVESGYGYNAVKDEYEDLVKTGVVDPTKVVRTGLQSAAAVATLLLTTEALVIDNTTDEAAAIIVGTGGTVTDLPK